MLVHWCQDMVTQEEKVKIVADLQANKHDHAARRGLLQMVGRRKRLLRYIAANDSKAYLALIKKLGIRR
jgi:small subunit ribosomal protein S15